MFAANVAKPLRGLPPVMCTAQPSRKKGQIRYKLKKAIDHAKSLCHNFEDTNECRVAWDEVNDLTRALHDQHPPKEPERSELSKREYDV
jgi:hypothetical protein